MDNIEYALKTYLNKITNIYGQVNDLLLVYFYLQSLIYVQNIQFKIK